MKSSRLRRADLLSSREPHRQPRFQGLHRIRILRVAKATKFLTYIELNARFNDDYILYCYKKYNYIVLIITLKRQTSGIGFAPASLLHQSRVESIQCTRAVAHPGLRSDRSIRRKMRRTISREIFWPPDDSAVAILTTP
jgi:hypothetical protein